MRRAPLWCRLTLLSKILLADRAGLAPTTLRDTDLYVFPSVHIFVFSILIDIFPPLH